MIIIMTIMMSIIRKGTLTALNTWITELFNLNFQSIEVVSRYRDTQLQVTANLCYF